MTLVAMSMTFNKKEILLEMTDKDWYDREEKVREKFDFLLAIFRASEDEEELVVLAEAFAKSGDLYTMPAVLARSHDTNFSDETRNKLKIAVDKMAIRIAIMDDLPLEDVSDPNFWRIKWTGSLDRYMTFSALITTGFRSKIFGEDSELFEEALASELGVDLSPHPDFQSYKSSITEWGLLFDAAKLLVHLDVSKMMCEVYEPGLDLSPERVFEDVMRTAKCDYLFTRFRLAGEFDENEHYLSTLLNLNGSELSFLES